MESELQTLHSLVVSLVEDRQWEEAAELGQQCLTRRAEVLGSHDRRTLRTMHALVVALQGLGRLQEALQLAIRHRELREEVLGPRHHLTLAAGELVADVETAAAAGGGEACAELMPWLVERAAEGDQECAHRYKRQLSAHGVHDLQTLHGTSIRRLRDAGLGLSPFLFRLLPVSCVFFSVRVSCPSPCVFCFVGVHVICCMCMFVRVRVCYCSLVSCVHALCVSFRVVLFFCFLLVCTCLS